ncbi:transmembrane protein, putative [Medicago truncatula]|uniref:Transmembrane protein, putative n=1 Tax=Medicago truncatula TaxID=3880 RepID=G7INB8_MEDTR|nr:transmembrane protein, putative [Medicago truncatula]
MCDALNHTVVFILTLYVRRLLSAVFVHLFSPCTPSQMLHLYYVLLLSKLKPTIQLVVDMS